MGSNSGVSVYATDTPPELGQPILYHRSDILNTLRQVFYIVQVFIPTTGLLVDFEVIEADEVDVNIIYGGNDTLGITCSELHARNRREDLNPYRWYLLRTILWSCKNSSGERSEVSKPKARNTAIMRSAFWGWMAIQISRSFVARGYP